VSRIPNIRDELLRFSEDIDPKVLFPVIVPEAADLALKDPFAFAIATCLDRGMKSEIIWTIPYDIKQELGHLDPHQIDQMSIDEISDLFERLPRKPRYIHDAPQTVRELTRKVARNYFGDASRLWKWRKAGDVKRTFQSIHGVGPGLANMAVLLIEKAFDVRFDDLDRKEMDIKPDVHTIRVLYRLGVSESRSESAAIEAARRLNPSYPGAVDMPLWYIGREWCSENAPKCNRCRMMEACPKIGL
jgi:endonuclease III